MFHWRKNTEGNRDKWYTPARDVANIGPELVRLGVVSLEEKFWEPWFKQYMADHSLSYEDLGPAAVKLAKGVNRIIALGNPTEALQESGFSELPPPLQAAFYCKMGQVLLAAIWAGIKDVSQPDSSPPPTIADIMAFVEYQYGKFQPEGANVTDPGAEAPHTDGPQPSAA